MVNFIADNKSSLENNIALQTIKDFFQMNLVDFQIISEIDYGSQYDGFCIVFGNEKIKATFRSSWQGLDYEILKGDSSIKLSDFDSEFKNILACSKTNLNFTLSVFKQFVDAESPI